MEWSIRRPGIWFHSMLLARASIRWENLPSVMSDERGCVSLCMRSHLAEWLIILLGSVSHTSLLGIRLTCSVKVMICQYAYVLGFRPRKGERRRSSDMCPNRYRCRLHLESELTMLFYANRAEMDESLQSRFVEQRTTLCSMSVCERKTRRKWKENRIIRFLVSIEKETNVTTVAWANSTCFSPS